MRVAYLVHFRGGRETGIYRKVREHVTEWSRRGVEVGLFVATDAAGSMDWADIPETKRIELLPGRPVLSIAARERLASALRHWRPDVVYARHGLVYPGFIRIARAIPTVLEINADDIPEFRLTSSWRYAYGRASRSLLLRAAAGFVFVTRELARSASFTSFRKPWVAIGNGIELAAFPTLPAPGNDRPRLLFVGHPHSPWHGLEHAGQLASAFPDWHVDVVGPTVEELADAPPNLRFHGRRQPDEYLPHVAGADVAIGSLALYRNHMDEASPLKVREYLARGIPTIIGYEDTDFPEPVPFLLQIPNRPDGVERSLPEIHAFVERSRGTRVPRESIGHLDVSGKEASRLAFLAKMASRSGGGE